MENVSKSKVIKPYLPGTELLADMQSANPAANEVAVWWLGQSGFAVKSGTTMIYIDPYVSEHLTHKYADTKKPNTRITESPLEPSAVSNADLVLSTHQHSDHMDPETIQQMMGSSTGAVYILPRAHEKHVLAWGVDSSRLIRADVDVPIQRSVVTVIPQPAAHERFDYVEGIGYPHMSYIVKLGGFTLCHLADTVPYPGMTGRIASHCTDIAFLPINGRDAARHALSTPGNTTIEEALCIAAAAAGKLSPN